MSHSSPVPLIPEPKAPRTPLRAEWENFIRLLTHALDFLHDYAFDLTRNGIQRRAMVVRNTYLIFFILVFFSSFWKFAGDHLQNLITALLNPEMAAVLGISLRAEVLIALGFALRVGAILLIPYFLAFYTASEYLSDLFELEDHAIAREFIQNAAFTGGTNVLYIREGEIAPETEKSPIVLIGGPGWVQIALDSAALFERPDGRPRVIGPTTVKVPPTKIRFWSPRQRGATGIEATAAPASSPGSGAETRLGHGHAQLTPEAIAQEQEQEAEAFFINGFERLRHPPIDLRDQFLGSPTGEPARIEGRSRDGIRVAATDVRFVFSVARSGLSPSMRYPYPFDPRAVEALIYGLSSRVSSGERASEPSLDWQNTMRTLIRNELSRFISEHPLSEFLASYGEPEVQRMQAIQNDLKQELQTVDPDHPATPPRKMDDNVPPFVPRPALKSLFDRFSSDFSTRARQRGVELHWLGLGTWETIPQIIPQHHEEAWRLSRENLLRGREEELRWLEEEAYRSELLRRIQSVPLSTFHEYFQLNPNKPRAIKRALLWEYCEQLKEARELYQKHSEIVPKELSQAIYWLERGAHFIGQTGPLSPPPPS